MILRAFFKKKRRKFSSNAVSTPVRHTRFFRQTDSGRQTYLNEREF
jgi:hypothetical protein